MNVLAVKKGYGNLVNILNNPGMTQVGAPSKAKKAKSFKYAQFQSLRNFSSISTESNRRGHP